MNNIQRVTIPVTFPAGVRIGQGKELGNLLTQSRDGSGQFVLRGTALAGAIRHALASTQPDNESAIEKWFGSSRAARDLVPSRIKFSDARLQVGDQTSRGIRIRSHNAIDRHRGAPIDGGLFSMESLPPGSSATLVVIVEATADETHQATELLQQIVGLFDHGLVLGGSASRGIGRAVLSGAALWKSWDLSDLDQHADWLDQNYRFKTDPDSFSGEKISPLAVDFNELVISLELAVPRGQDFVVGDGQGAEFDMEPQKVRAADGREAWLLPGSTLRGLFRAYINRLAAREGKPVADSYDRWKLRNENPRSPQPLTGDDVAFGFVPETERGDFYDDPELIECPVMRLFGSSFARGRIHITDSISIDANRDGVQARTHVAIDRFSGGANEGFLFDNQTLTRGSFAVTIVIKNPTNDEAKWIAQCIRALDMGLIRVGASKGSGRLALAQAPKAQGPFNEIINALEPSETCRG